MVGEGAGIVVEVGGINFDPLLKRLDPQQLGQQNGDRIGFFACSAASYPDAKLLVEFVLHQQLGEDIVSQCIESIAVTEESRHPDQQVFVQSI